MRPYYAVDTGNNETNISIYGDITSYAGEWDNANFGDISAHLLSKKIDGIESDVINVYINSYGGEVAEGVAIHNALKRHKAKVRTYCDGFACSAASVVFMAGDERIMYDASLLMIHNAWTCASGNAEQLRKAADDMETISAAAAGVYQAAVNIDGGELARMLAEETWISPQDAVRMGFATGIEKYKAPTVPVANARAAVLARMQANPALAAKVDTDAIAQRVVEMLKQEAGFEDEPGHEESITFLKALMRKEATK